MHSIDDLQVGIGSREGVSRARSAQTREVRQDEEVFWDVFMEDVECRAEQVEFIPLAVGHR